MEVKVKFTYREGIRVVDSVTVSIDPPQLMAAAEIVESIQKALEVKSTPMKRPF